MVITSKDNVLIKEVRRLLSDAKYRRRSGRFAVEGARLCADAARSGIVLTAMLYTERAAATYADALAPLLADPALRRECISEELARHVGDTVSPQGVFCIGCQRTDGLTAADVRPTGKYMLLEQVQDPANLGAILRTAEAFGLDGLFLTEDCCDLYNPKVLRGSMGGAFRQPLGVVENPAAFAKSLAQTGLSCYACVLSENAIPLQQADLSGGTLCLIGNEGNGLRPETAAACRPLYIPMRGEAESLNAAVAAGIVLWSMTAGEGR